LEFEENGKVFVLHDLDDLVDGITLKVAVSQSNLGNFLSFFLSFFYFLVLSLLSFFTNLFIK